MSSGYPILIQSEGFSVWFRSVRYPCPVPIRSLVRTLGLWFLNVPHLIQSADCPFLRPVRTLRSSFCYPSLVSHLSVIHLWFAYLSLVPSMGGIHLWFPNRSLVGTLSSGSVMSSSQNNLRLVPDYPLSVSGFRCRSLVEKCPLPISGFLFRSLVPECHLVFLMDLWFPVCPISSLVRTIYV